MRVGLSGDIEDGVTVALDVSVSAGACFNVLFTYLCVADAWVPIR